VRGGQVLMVDVSARFFERDRAKLSVASVWTRKRP
jgi:hypothetical protein